MGFFLFSLNIVRYSIKESVLFIVILKFIVKKNLLASTEMNNLNDNLVRCLIETDTDLTTYLIRNRDEL